MKRFLLYLLTVVSIVACSEGEPADNGSDDGGGNTPTTPTITLNKSSVSFDELADEESISFSTTADWIAEIVNDRADGWLSVTPQSGSAGDASITIKAKENDTPDERNASVRIKAGSASKTISVSQKQKDALTVTASKFEVEAEGGEVKIEVKANIDFEYAIDESAKEWIKYEGTRAMKTSTLTFSVAKNDDTDKREGKIAIKSGEFNEVVTIYQAGSEPSIVISQNEYVVSSDGETISVEVSSNVDVAVEMPTDADWISENTTRATSTNTYRFDIQPNEDYDQRTAEIKFTNKENNISEVVKVTQVQKDALVVAKESYTVESDGGQLHIEVGHNVDFDIEISNDWITKAENTRAFVTETLNFNIAKNPTTDNREGTIVFKSKDGKLTQTVKVYQAQEDALIISKKDIVVSDEGGTISFELQTNVEFKVSEPDVDWLRAVVTRGLTTHTLHYEYDANSSYDSREAHIVVTNTNTNASETITITQAQKDAIVLAKSEYELGTEGGELDFDIQTNVDITVTISDTAKSWITQVETRGLETKTLHFDIAACAADEDREGTITISGGNAKQIITVKQILPPIYIPDHTFKAYCIENFDSNNDGEISMSEALNVTSIEVYSDNIESLQGIEHFKNLAWLSVPPKHNESWGIAGDWRLSGHYLNGKRVSGMITELDLTQNPKLQYLDCSGNQIKTLDLTNNPLLYCVHASYNLDLTSIRFTSDKNKVQILELSATSIEEIDISSLTELEILSIDRGLGLKSIDISEHPKITTLNVGGNKLETLDVSNNPAIEHLDCCANSNLTLLDISNNTRIRYLGCMGCSLTSIKGLVNNPNLETLWCHENQLTMLDVSTLKNLRSLYCRYNNLTSLDVSQNTKLDNISFMSNKITSIDVSNNTLLTQLESSINPITSIDVSKNTILKELWCHSMDLSILDLTNNPDLEWLTTLNNPNLSTIYVTSEQSFEYTVDGHTSFTYKGDDVTLYESTDYSKDGEVKQLQKATKGDGIDIVLMGDAYSDRLIADGTYDQTMQTAMEKFFEEEPYKSFRDHFNVYSVTAVSKNEVYNLVSSTALAGYFGGGTLVGGNDQRAFYYAQRAIGEERMDEALIVVMMNSTAYAGTCYMYNPTVGDYGDGISVSYFPVGEDAESLGRLIHHEAAGHGFSKLGDEYAYENMGAISESEITSARAMAEYGWWKNIDFTNDHTKVKWNHFLTDSRYTNDGLGVYEGAFTYWTGAYRPTQNSIMNTNVGGFNAPSRESIYYRIHKLAYGEDWEYDYEEFVEWDAKNRITTRGIPYRLDIPDNFQPTHPPVVVKSSWRSAKNNAPKKAATNNGGNAGGNLRPATSNRTNQQTMSISPNRTVSSSGMVVTIDPATGRKAIERMEIK